MARTRSPPKDPRPMTSTTAPATAGPSPTPPAVAFETVAELLEHLGDVPPFRVRLRPVPGTATEQDVIDIEARENRLFELVDGVLVEKGMGYHESRLALLLGHYLES